MLETSTYPKLTLSDEIRDLSDEYVPIGTYSDERRVDRSGGEFGWSGILR